MRIITFFDRPHLLAIWLSITLSLSVITLLLTATASAQSRSTPPSLIAQSPSIGFTCFARVGAATPISGSDLSVVQSAVNAASTGSWIKIAGTCAGGPSVVITKALGLEGGYATSNWNTSNPGLNPTILDGLHAGRVITANAPLTISNLTLQNGLVSADGAGLLTSRRLYLTNTNILSNTADPGFSGGGGGVYAAMNVTVINCLFQNNQTLDGQGGGLYAGGTLILTNTQFTSNTSVDSGGGASVNSNALLFGGVFQKNQTTSFGNGGGLNVDSDLLMQDTQFLSNTAQNEGGGLLVGGAAMLTGGLFRNNRTANNDGGGFAGFNSLHLTGTQFISNSANNNGVDIAYGEIVLNAAIFRDNRSRSDTGGGVYAVSELTILPNTQFISNTAQGYGGGAFASGATTLNGGLFQNNQANKGGGLYSSDTLAMTGTQFLSNRGASNASGVYFAGSDARIVNTIFARNAESGSEAIFITSTGHSQILFSTFAGSPSKIGIAVYVNGGTVGITNTIITSYTTGIYRNSGSAYEDYNLFQNNTFTKTGTTGGTHDVIGDPRYLNISLNDYHIITGSAAIDKGAAAGVATDLDRHLRPNGSGFDIGAYEFGTVINVYLPLVLKNF